MTDSEKYDLMIDEIDDLKQESKNSKKQVERLIEELQNEKELREIDNILIEKLKEERLSLLKDLQFACGSQPSASSELSICDICKHKNTDNSCNKQCFMSALGALNKWEWRGVQK